MNGDRILRPRSVAERVGVCRQQLYQMVRTGELPPPVAICGTRAVGWLESSIDQWIKTRPVAGPGSVLSERRKREAAERRAPKKAT
ncbi:MAG: AlpA family phage regulatory protein [Xanthobacteraceae bacterium]